jgi:hypothetical protein
MAAYAISASLLTLEEKKALLTVQGDLASIYAALAVLTAKLDADAGVTDTNYTSLCTPAAQQLTT